MKSFSWILCLTGVYASMLVALTITNWVGADRFWLTALNLYIPQLIWTIPGIILTVLIFKTDPSLVWLPMLCVLWVLGPVMGCKWSPPALSMAGQPRLRMMTWNVKYGSYELAPLMEEMARSKPDLVFLQDAGGSLGGPLGYYFRNWHVRASGQYVIASKLPLSEAELLELPYFGNTKESLLRCRMFIGPHSVALYNVHLKTPRWSLNAFRAARRRPWYLPEAIERLQHNVNTRWLQALAVVGYLNGETGPIIVAGDLNSPDASLACGALRSGGLHDAFAERGIGYGFTYGQLLLKNRLPWLQYSWMRIDHIMLSSRFTTERCWAGTGEASDHRPVIADLVLQNP